MITLLLKKNELVYFILVTKFKKKKLINKSLIFFLLGNHLNIFKMHFNYCSFDQYYLDYLIYSIQNYFLLILIYILNSICQYQFLYALIIKKHLLLSFVMNSLRKYPLNLFILNL